MKLNELLKECEETQDDFFDRTYWGAGKEGDKVFVFKNRKDRSDPKIKPTEIMELDDARRYVRTLPERSESDGGDE